MTDIIFYDFDFNRLGDFSRLISANMEKKYCGYGSAELHFSIDEEQLIELLENNEYLFFTAGDNSAIVTGWQLGEDIAVYGRTPEWLLTKRGVQPLSFSGNTAETIARAFVESVADFIAPGELADVGTATSYSTKDIRVLYDAVCEVLSAQKLGFKVTPDIAGKKFVFEVYEGMEKLSILSASNRTAYDMKYTVEKQDMVTNSGWYEQRYTDKGGWNAQANNPVLLNNQPSNAYTFYKITSADYSIDGEMIKRFGLWCRKGTYLYCDNPQGEWKIAEDKPDTVWVYTGNSAETGIKKWEAVLNGTRTAEEARTELLQKTAIATADCEVRRLEYGKDYSLGDIVRVQLEFEGFRKTEKKRVAAVNIYYDIDRSGVTPILNSLEG